MCVKKREKKYFLPTVQNGYKTTIQNEGYLIKYIR